ncbi:MAG: glycosyltransferase family 4 protein [Actinobacteria bacterium]|nr:glycosyltransferase family 4 protein [Actinomycetota bacterium]
MKALFITTALHRGGAERQLITLLPRLAARGVEPSLLTLRERGAFFEELTESGIRTGCAGLQSRTDLAGMRRALRFAQPLPEIIVSQGVDALVVGALLARRADVPHIVIEHGGPGLGRRAHRRLLTRALAPSLARVVAVTRAQTPGLRRWGYRADRIVVIPNGVEDAPPPVRERAALRLELGVAGDGFLAAFIGSLRAPKRPLAFVDAVAATPGVHGVVIGSGPLRPEVERRAANVAVRVLGEREDVADLLGAADVLCVISDIEALPMAALEGMRAGLPLVASAVGGLPEAVEDGVTGLLLAPRDDHGLAAALRRLAGDPALAHRLGAAGRDRYLTLFSADRMADGYEDLLRSVADERRRRGT